VLLYQGSLRSLRASFADVVIANISAAAAIQLAPEARRVSKTGAAAIISGFRARQRNRVRAALEAAGFTERESREREGWQALLCYTR
jgi:ribosomal protein L11 methylase PrmA